MITICHDGQEIELEDLEHAKWALDAVQMSMEDGARGMEGLADASRSAEDYGTLLPRSWRRP